MQTPVNQPMVIDPDLSPRLSELFWNPAIPDNAYWDHVRRDPILNAASAAIKEGVIAMLEAPTKPLIPLIVVKEIIPKACEEEEHACRCLEAAGASLCREEHDNQDVFRTTLCADCHRPLGENGGYYVDPAATGQAAPCLACNWPITYPGHFYCRPCFAKRLTPAGTPS
jgi:hypothetical protein